jgi:hypothetical protein
MNSTTFASHVPTAVAVITPRLAGAFLLVRVTDPTKKRAVCLLERGDLPSSAP